MYNVVPYKSKLIHVEDDIINLSPIKQNINNYLRKKNNCGEESSMALLDDNQLCDTIIVGNTDMSGNNITEIRHLVLSSLVFSSGHRN